MERFLKTFRRHCFTGLIVVLAGLAQTAQTKVIAEPVRPIDDGLVLATVAPGRASTAIKLRAEQAALARDPLNIELAIKIARTAIEEGRINADPRRYGQAQAALAPWWKSSAPPDDIRVLRAVVLQAFHDFKAAAADLDAVLAQSPANAQARLSRAFVRMVTGDTDGAKQDCFSLPSRAGLMAAQICRARIEALTGAEEQAFMRLQRLLNADTSSSEPMHRFALAVMADVALALGRTGEAERYFVEASSAGTREAALLAAHADLLLDADRPAEVLNLLDGKGEADIIMLRQAIAARRLNDPRLAALEAVLDERFAASKASGVRVHLREEARYRLEVKGDDRLALQLARDNWSVQKEPADARLLLECALAVGDKTAAADVTGFVRRTGLNDKRLAPLIARLEGS